MKHVTVTLRADLVAQCHAVTCGPVPCAHAVRHHRPPPGAGAQLDRCDRPPRRFGCSTRPRFGANVRCDGSVIATDMS